VKQSYQYIPQRLNRVVSAIGELQLITHISRLINCNTKLINFNSKYTAHNRQYTIHNTSLTTHNSGIATYNSKYLRVFCIKILNSRQIAQYTTLNSQLKSTVCAKINYLDHTNQRSSQLNERLFITQLSTRNPTNSSQFKTTECAKIKNTEGVIVTFYLISRVKFCYHVTPEAFYTK
jgi:hypothetical protein